MQGRDGELDNRTWQRRGRAKRMKGRAEEAMGWHRGKQGIRQCGVGSKGQGQQSKPRDAREYRGQGVSVIRHTARLWPGAAYYTFQVLRGLMLHRSIQLLASSRGRLLAIIPSSPLPPLFCSATQRQLSDRNRLLASYSADPHSDSHTPRGGQ